MLKQYIIKTIIIAALVISALGVSSVVTDTLGISLTHTVYACDGPSGSGGC